jgi:hypothetical protein
MATIAVFVALGGTSYAVLGIDSGDVTDNSLRSRDIRNNNLRSRDIRNRSLSALDVRRNSLGGGIIRESTLGLVPRAAQADRLGSATADDLRIRCPADTTARGGICVETSARPADGFFGAVNHCDQAGRGLITLPQLDAFLRSNGPLPKLEWTSTLVRNSTNGGALSNELESVLFGGTDTVDYERVFLAVQHPFRCVALPSN